VSDPTAPGSVPFDRAAEFYDRTRGISDEAMGRTVEMLRGELGPRGRVLEVGVGTGLLALPLHRAGVSVVGLDLSEPMLGKLVEKAGGRAPFPLVRGDATRLPFADDAFGGGYLRWVLHLIPDWRSALAEVVRVLVPRATFLANLGAYGGERAEIQRRFSEIVGRPADPVGLGWGEIDELDRVLAALGARPRELPFVREAGEGTLAEFLDGVTLNRYSWTWPIPDPERILAHRELVSWARARFGDLERPREFEHASRWRAYDLGP
jgi:SAM-dependent methyltransferase